jgi:hypothetical protein
MDRKELKKTKGATAKKTKIKPKKTPVRKKKVVGSKTKKEKKKTSKKTVKKEIRKVEVKVKTRKEKTAGKEKKKEAKKVKVEKEQKADKKKVAKKAKKKVTPHLGKKVEVKQITAKPQKKITHKEVPVPEKEARRQEKVLFPRKEERYPPLPVEILPEEYGEDSISLMTVDPRKLFIYWEVTEETFKKHKGTLNIRLYDVTDIEFDGTNANSYLDMVVNSGIGNLYLVVNPAKEFIVDIGITDSSGTFGVVARSNKVSTPRSEVMGKGILPQRLYETGVETGSPIPPIGYEK